MPTPATETRTRPQDEAGLGPAAKGVAEHASALARLEVRLALLELKQKLTALGLGIGLALGGALLALYGLGFGLATIAAALATALATWLAAPARVVPDTLPTRSSDGWTREGKAPRSG